MRVLLINTFEKKGGAAIACSRLFRALLKQGIDSYMLVRNRESDNQKVFSVDKNRKVKIINKLRFLWERMVILINNKLSKSKLFSVSLANTGNNICNHSLVKDSEILHLHWFQQGLLSINNLAELINSGKPVVWTMHDTWAFTGICHHMYECDNYKEKCGKCFYLNSNCPEDLSHKVWEKKQFIENTGIQFVAVSQWLKEKAESSSLLRNSNIVVIPNAIDTNLFCPSDKIKTRQKLNLPVNKKIILMGAPKLNDPIKGFIFLKNALEILVSSTYNQDDFILVLFGNIKNDVSFLNNIVIPTKYFGPISNVKDIIDLYVAADITVVPSLYETFGQTISESMACGTPVISFNNSGQTDIINHKINGYLAQYKNSLDLANGIKWVLYETDYLQLSANARIKIENSFSEDIVGKKYIELYESMISKNVKSKDK